MTLKLFEQELRKESKLAYATIRDGSRKKKMLDKKNKRSNSLTDIMCRGKNKINMQLFNGCIRSYGNVLEKTTMDYAKIMGTKTYPNKNFLAVKIDIVFRIKNNVYNLESKSNIELDAGKTRKAIETLNRKHKTVFHALDCNNEGWQVISKFVVWTKATAKEASEIAKKPMEEKQLMGFKDFFALFKIDVETEEFFNMLQKVFKEEVEDYF